MRILVFGDSIVNGFWDNQGGWVQRLKNYTDKQSLKRENQTDTFTTVYGLGISSETTEELIKRFESEVNARLINEDLVIIFAIGLNDSYELIDKQKNRVLEDRFKENLQTLIDKAKKLAQKIYFVGLTPVDESKVTPMPWAPEFSYHNDQIELYDSIIKEICAKNNIDFIEILNEFKNMDCLKLLKDGAHPNTAGHDLIFEIVKKFLKDKAII